MDLLIYFAFPIATIIIAAILQKILKSPVAVAALIFAIFLIVTFAVYDETFLIATLVYSIIALITAFVVSQLCSNKDGESDDDDTNICGCNNSNTTTTTTTCGCNRYRRF